MPQRIIPHVIREPQQLTTFGPQVVCQDVADRLTHLNIGAALIVDEGGCLAGILTERDLVRRLLAPQKNAGSVTAGEIMTADPVTLKGDETVKSALMLMEKGGFRHLPVVDESNKPIAIVSIRDLFRTVKDELEVELDAVEQLVFGESYGQ